MSYIKWRLRKSEFFRFPKGIDGFGPISPRLEKYLNFATNRKYVAITDSIITDSKNVTNILFYRVRLR